MATFSNRSNDKFYDVYKMRVSIGSRFCLLPMNTRIRFALEFFNNTRSVQK